MKKKKHNLKGGCDFNQLVPSECESSVDIKDGLAGKMMKEDGTYQSMKWCELIQIICPTMRHCFTVNELSCKVTVTSLDRCYSKQNIMVSFLERVPHLWRLKHHLPAHLSHSRWYTGSSLRGFLNHLTYLIKMASLGILLYLYVSSPRNRHGFCDPEPADSLGQPWHLSLMMLCMPMMSAAAFNSDLQSYSMESAFSTEHCWTAWN